MHMNNSKITSRDIDYALRQRNHIPEKCAITGCISRKYLCIAVGTFATHVSGFEKQRT